MNVYTSICPVCFGSRLMPVGDPQRLPGARLVTCTRCAGAGVIEERREDEPPALPAMETL